MANATVSRIGQIDGAGDAKAIFLKVFAGEVLAAFRTKTQFMQRHTVRTIASGKTAQFPVTWKGGSSYHTPGDELVGSVVNHNEVTIDLDDQLVADRFIADIDEAMSHFDIRRIYSEDVADALAQQYDINVAQVGFLAARASANVSGGNGGSAITDADADTNGASHATSIFTAIQTLDEKDTPRERFVFVKPAQFYDLVETDKLLNRDFGGNPGIYSDGTILRVAGAQVVMSNNVPSTNVTTGPAAYQGNFSTSVSLVMTKEAVGTVKLLDLSVRADYDPRRLGTLMVAKYALGHGVLRPECAVEIKTA